MDTLPKNTNELRSIVDQAKQKDGGVSILSRELKKAGVLNTRGRPYNRKTLETLALNPVTDSPQALRFRGDGKPTPPAKKRKAQAHAVAADGDKSDHVDIAEMVLASRLDRDKQRDILAILFSKG